VSIAINGGVVAGHGISLDIFGDRGTLSARGVRGLGFQMSDIQLFGAQAPDRELKPLAVEPGYDPRIIPEGLTGHQPYPGVEVPRATLVNVANLYRDLASAIGGGVEPSPSFRDGLDLHLLLDRIEAAAP
jgi:predicted dehydrogenase